MKITRTPPYLALKLFFHISSTAAAPPLSPPFPSAPFTPSLSLTSSLTNGINATKQVALLSDLTSFPPGPPPSTLDYDIPGSDLNLELSALGLIRGRNERVVKQVMSEAIQASVNPYRPQTALSEDGYQLQHGGFLLGVTPSAQIPGEERLTWGMWTKALTGIHGYVEAYPGYDFSFEIWLIPAVGQSQGYVIGAGFALTRRR